MSNKQSMWLKYRHKWAHGPDKDWIWIFVGIVNHDDIEETIMGLNEPYLDDEHHRGIEYTLHRFPPKPILLREIRGQTAKIHSANEYLKRLLEELQEYEQEAD